MFIPKHMAGPIGFKLLNLKQQGAVLILEEEWSNGCISLSLTGYHHGRRESFSLRPKC